MEEENFYKKVRKELERQESIVSALKKILRSYNEAPQIKKEKQKRKNKQRTKNENSGSVALLKKQTNKK